MRRAAKVDTTQGDIIKALRKCGCEVEVIKGRKGLPDLLVMDPVGFLSLVEVKSPGGVRNNSETGKAQAKFAEVWPVHRCESVDQALEALGLKVRQITSKDRA